MNFFRLVIFFIFIYLGYRILKILMQFFSPTPAAKSSPEVKMKKENAKLNIKKEDIIEVDFEELKSQNSETEKK